MSDFPVTFKFMERKWAEKFVTGESIMLGTLEDYRSTEIHGLKKGDRMEGNVGFADLDPFAIDKTPNIREQIKARGITLEGNYLGDNTYQYFQKGPNDYVLCLTTEPDPKMLPELDPKYDALVRIGNVKLLMERLTASMEMEGIEIVICGLGPITYRSRTVGRDGKLDTGPFYKDPIFSGQREYRLAWRPKSSKFKPRPFKIDPSDCGLELLSVPIS